ncbi:MAG: hypothetical protein P8163_22805 [Candidatus Thiodiazotropha sp.]
MEGELNISKGVGAHGDVVTVNKGEGILLVVCHFGVEDGCGMRPHSQSRSKLKR